MFMKVSPMQRQENVVYHFILFFQNDNVIPRPLESVIV